MGKKILYSNNSPENNRNISQKLEDVDHIIVKCSSCDKALVEIWVVSRDSVDSKIVANCPFCGDKSFIYEINGQFLLGHMDDTVIVDTDVDDNNIVNINVIKEV